MSAILLSIIALPYRISCLMDIKYFDWVNIIQIENTHIHCHFLKKEKRITQVIKFKEKN